jgi:hypothetical protein
MHLFDECSWHVKEKCLKRKKIDNRKMFEFSEINAHVWQTLLLSHVMINQQFKSDDKSTQWKSFTLTITFY